MESTTRNRIGVALFLGAFAFLIGAITIASMSGKATLADPDDSRQIVQGKSIYEQQCGACHGARLEGQPNWQDRLPSGRLPAPPHDASGHTWHHPDAVLFGITKHGMVPGKYAPPMYESDMPAFDGILSDGDIWAVLAYIKSTWPREIRNAQHDANSAQVRR
jgi:mono/diheme cytochrome c family protein